MGIVQWIIVNVPVWGMLFVVIGGYTLFTIGIAFLCHAILRRVQFSKETEEELRQAFTVGATLFSIVLGFLVVVTWQEYLDVERNVVKEASAVETLYQQSDMLRPGDALAFKQHLRAYTHAVIDEEWSKLPELGESQAAKDSLAAMWAQAGTIAGAKDGEITIGTSVFESLKTIGEARSTRLYDSRVSLPWFFWSFIIAFSVFIIVLVNMFKNRQIRQRLVINSLLGVCMGAMFMFIMLIDYPFSGETGIKPAAFEEVLERIEP